METILRKCENDINKNTKIVIISFSLLLIHNSALI